MFEVTVSVHKLFKSLSLHLPIKWTERMKCMSLADKTCQLCKLKCGGGGLGGFKLKFLPHCRLFICVALKSTERRGYN
jgi:hypothetical protein